MTFDTFKMAFTFRGVQRTAIIRKRGWNLYPYTQVPVGTITPKCLSS